VRNDPVDEKRLVVGSNSSVDAVALDDCPPTMSTRPSSSNVAVCAERGSLMDDRVTIVPVAVWSSAGALWTASAHANKSGATRARRIPSMDQSFLFMVGCLLGVIRCELEGRGGDLEPAGAAFRQFASLASFESFAAFAAFGISPLR
jgi:hypothetical protein